MQISIVRNNRLEVFWGQGGVVVEWRWAGGIIPQCTEDC